jgi:large subunit ribosomal protein L15
MANELNLSDLQPAQPRKDRKRVGRGPGSGKGRYSGRGIKGQKSRSGSHMMRAGFEGGQMPIYMRVPKLRGATSKDAMPIGPFRTYQQPVNVRDLEGFADGTEITPELLKQHGLISKVSADVKILGDGDLTKRLTVSAHGVSASARTKIEQAGGTVVLLREPKAPKAARPKRAAAADTASEAEPDTAAAEAAAVAPETEEAGS